MTQHLYLVLHTLAPAGLGWALDSAEGHTWFAQHIGIRRG